MHQTLRSTIADADIDLGVIALVDVLGILKAHTIASCQGDKSTSAYVSMDDTPQARLVTHELRRLVSVRDVTPWLDKRGLTRTPRPRKNEVTAERHPQAIVWRFGTNIDPCDVAHALWAVAPGGKTAYQTGLFGEVTLHESVTHHVASHHR